MSQDGTKGGQGEAGSGGPISCHEAVERVYEYLDGELDAETVDRIREHLEICKLCYPYFNFERIFLDHIRSRGRRARVDPELESRIREVLREMS